jgi:hypothetical protein
LIAGPRIKRLGEARRQLAKRRDVRHFVQGVRRIEAVRIRRLDLRYQRRSVDYRNLTSEVGEDRRNFAGVLPSGFVIVGPDENAPAGERLPIRLVEGVGPAA